VLAKNSKLGYKLCNNSELDLQKSAGPATVVLVSTDKSGLSELKSVIDKPINVVARLTQ